MGRDGFLRSLERFTFDGLVLRFLELSTFNGPVGDPAGFLMTGTTLNPAALAS
jgi:hypothetical protein